MKNIILFICLLVFGFTTSTNSSNDLTSGPKIVICHVPPGNPDNTHAIEININALPAHLAHGDLIGDCNSDCEFQDCE